VYARDLGLDWLSRFAGAEPIERRCSDEFAGERPQGICVLGALLESVQMETTRHYYRDEEQDLGFEDGPEERCRAEGGAWTVP
jgi:hypothetical protein